MSEGRDTHCGTGDPWVMFAHGAKSPETIAMLREWAEDPAEQQSGAVVALEALSETEDPALLGFWQKQLAVAPRGSHRRSHVVVGLINMGAPGIAAALALLGESDELDSVIVIGVTNRDSSKATLDTLRAHAARSTTSAATRRRITESWLHVSRGDDATGARVALMTSPDTELALSAVRSSERSAQALRHSLQLLARPELSAFDRRQLAWDMGDNLARLLERADPAAQQLAATWVRSKDQLLLKAPYVQLVLGSWLQSGGDLAGAEALFLRSLAAGGAMGKLERHPIEGDPVIPLAVTRLLLACQLEGGGRRKDALQHFNELAPSLEMLRSESREVLESFRFGYRPSGCSLHELEQVLKQPLQLSFKHREVKEGVEMTLSFTNTSEAATKVKACPGSRGGFVPAGELIMTERGGRLDEDFDCRSPVEREVAPGQALVGTVLARRRPPSGRPPTPSFSVLHYPGTSRPSLWAITSR